MARTAKQARDKWEERIKISGKYMKEGIQNPRADWLERVKATESKRDAGLRAAMDDGRITAGAEKAGTRRWQDRAMKIGVPHWETEAPKSGDRYESSIGPVISCVESAKAEVAGLAEDTVEQRAEKSKQYQIAMSNCMKLQRGY
ncbi:MAG: hypothetical protein HWN68_11800 [Desulfobacterales bacterium]|nr:hypothetical protein [Desulfobacterales bacterium]